MTISLRIDNCDALPDGGPLQFSATGRSFEIGREPQLDWTLPDANRVISGRHCEIRFEDGAYVLYDVSRNGTFLNGAHGRVKSPYRLADGDRLQIGHYIIAVSIAPAAGAGAAAQAAAESIWDTGTPAPPPIARRDLMPPQRRGKRAPDFSEEYLELPRPRPAAARTESPFANPSVAASAEPRLPASADPVRPVPFGGEPFSPAGPPPAAPPPVMPRAAGLSVPASADAALLSRLAAGAGVSPAAFGERDPGAVAEEVGAVLRILVEELTQLLKARAAAKVLARSGSRTMIGATDNNPLKFIPRPEEAIEIMFGRRRAGYLDARRSVQDSFDDIKTHELATYAAMQKALARLLEDLSPEAIEKKVSGAAFGSRKSRAWDTFVATWEAKAETHENGMLDVFLAYFADAYGKASKQK
jgi:type VI secretion system protein ImpI